MTTEKKTELSLKAVDAYKEIENAFKKRFSEGKISEEIHKLSVNQIHNSLRDLLLNIWYLD